MTPDLLPARKALFPSWALKVAMAVTGLIWVLFVLVHLYGNLKVFLGPDAFNGYAFWLREAFYPLFPKQGVLWLMRVVLATALAIHVAAGAILWVRGRRGGTKRSRLALRDRSRAARGSLQSLSATLMPFTGVIILIFLVFHVLDLTVGWAPFGTVTFAGHTTETSFAYANLVASFSRPAIAAGYSLTMILLSLHVWHGVQTAAQDLGAMGYRLRRAAVWAAGLSAIAILLGNGAIPVLVQMGVLA